jgi:hypothetical protein
MNMAWNQKYGCFDVTKQLQIIYDVHDVSITILDLDHWMKIKMVVNHFTS